MLVLVTGTTKGIGRAIALKFLSHGHEVIGIDRLESSIDNPKYKHYIADVGKLSDLPSLEVLPRAVINNAGSLENDEAIEKKLMGVYYVSEKYAFHDKIKAVINISSNSAHYGIEPPLYVMANGGVLSYTKNLARRLAQYQATVNSISPGYVDTTLDQHIVDEGLDSNITEQCLLHHTQEPKEIANLAYYLAIENKSITGQDILVDCGECLSSKFVETEENIKKWYRSDL